LACLVDLVASGWARGLVEGVRGVQESEFLDKGQREGVGRAATRFSKSKPKIGMDPLSPPSKH
jgi:hypothetical protein